MRKYGSVLFLLMVGTLAISAHTGRVIEPDSRGVEGAKVRILEGDSLISITSTDFEGRFTTDGGGGGYVVVVNAEGFDELRTEVRAYNIGDLVLTPKSKDLSEVVVTPKDYIQEFDHRTYKLSKSQLERYSNFYLALSEIPQLSVVDGLRYKGLEGVRLLLNGIEVTPDEVAALAKDDVKDIEVYDIPPLRFMDGKTTSVINIVTKRNITGGNVYLSLGETPYHWYSSDNSIRSFYNYGKNRFSLSYEGHFRNRDDSSVDEIFEYRTLSETLTKRRVGLPSKRIVNEHYFTASYLFSDPDGKEATQFNARVNGEITDKHSYDKGVVYYGYNNTGHTTYTPTNDKMANFNLDLYFHRTFGDKQLLMANVVANIYDTNTYSMLEEYGDDSIEPDYRSETATDGRIYSLITQLEYSYRFGKAGRLAATTRYYWQRTRQITDLDKAILNRNALDFALAYNVRFGKLYAYAKLGGAYSVFNYADGLNQENIMHFVPMFYLSWDITDKMSLSANYWRERISPQASEMTRQTHIVDRGLHRSGNPLLHSYASNRLTITNSLSLRKFQYSLSVACNISPGYIMPSYERRDDYVLEKPTNSDWLRSVTGIVYLSYTPVKGLRFSGNGMFGKSFMKTMTGRWSIPVYRFNAGVSWYLTKWEFSIGYQFPGHEAYGVYERKRIQGLDITASFKPVSDMSIGLSVSNPFMDTTEELFSVDRSVMSYSNIAHVEYFKSAVTLSFSWNLEFGRRRVKEYKNLDNSDKDSGVLR
jgi:hypothetical protein